MVVYPEGVWYSYRTRNGIDYWKVNPKLATKEPLFDRVKLAAAVGRVSFFVNAGLRFVTELCKMRAFTALWDEICRERYGVEDPKHRLFRYGVQVNSLGLTEQQPENNVYRILLEMLAVTLSRNARARAVQLPAWNEALGLPRPWDQQWSLRMQQILAYETDLLEYGDLFDGSPVVQAKVDALIAEAKEELARIAEMAISHNFFVISDEIYEKIVYDGFEFASIATLGEEIKKKTVIVHGVAKTYAMTGWRIGYAAGPEEIIAAMTNIQSQSTSNPTSIAQKASVEALIGPQDEVRKMVSAFAERRRYIVDRLNRMEGVSCYNPAGAFYAFPNFSSYYGRSYKGKRILNSTDLADYFLDEARVAVVPGGEFGADRFERLSFATSMENIEEGLTRIEDALRKLE
mgnify:CR=1 FL=1